ncbi:CLUMA_CG020249, isoform A [Clunio marinus]|uniref:CLUMA_CG020249, isoform A n=1 Tax=Clunio marinus TaxID=568069 RepID=A0A1J1J724_9DIPT|nr:CLUMA_CG020249, isoform A [Clunio marinus]
MEDAIPDHREALKKNHNKTDLVARWVIPIKGKLYDIEFEHGIISGKRVIWINGKDILRRDMMYRLVGEDTFFVEGKRCIIHIFPSSGFKYTYKLFIDGLECEIYNQTQSKILKTWEIKINDKNYRVVLEKDTLNTYLNGDLRDEKPEFVDGGTDTQFTEDGHIFIVSARSGNRNEPICYKLAVNGAVQEVV